MASTSGNYDFGSHYYFPFLLAMKQDSFDNLLVLSKCHILLCFLPVM
ncbi:hypothetical protein [Peribacillus butanolivorans]